MGASLRTTFLAGSALVVHTLSTREMRRGGLPLGSLPPSIPGVTRRGPLLLWPLLSILMIGFSLLMVCAVPPSGRKRERELSARSLSLSLSPLGDLALAARGLKPNGNVLWVL